MNLTENFESVKKFAVDAAQTATQKAKILAAVAKANVSIYAEEDKIRKAEAQLGKLYYRDYAVGEEMDTAGVPSVVPEDRRIQEAHCRAQGLHRRCKGRRCSACRAGSHLRGRL